MPRPRSARPCTSGFRTRLTEILADFVVRFLEQLGVRYVFGLTGHSIFHLTDALYRAAGIEFIPTQSELAAAYKAEAYARSSRRLGVCLVSEGPGAANMLGGVAHAFKEGTPLLALSSDVSTRVAGKSANWHEINQRAIFAPVTKYAATLARPEDISLVLCEAVRQATTDRGGPAYVGIPSDLLTCVIDAGPDLALQPPPRVAADESLIQSAVDVLANAERPIILAGAGVYWSSAETETRALAELLQAPFGTPYSQKGLLPEDDPLALGVIGSGAAPFANTFVLEADVILALGVSFGQGLTLGYGHRVIPATAHIIQVDADALEIGRTYPVRVGIAADVKDVAAQIRTTLQRAEFAPRPAATERLEQLTHARGGWRTQVAALTSDSTAPIDYWSIADALRATLPDDGILVGAVTELKLQRFVARSKVFHTGDFRAIGHGLASALGVKFACPERKVVLLTGDGSFMMELPELATLARHHPDLPVLVVHNGAYASMKRDQLHLFEGRFVGTDIFTPDLCELAQSFGIAARRVELRAELQPAFEEVINRGGPALLDIICPVEGL